MTDKEKAIVLDALAEIAVSLRAISISLTVLVDIVEREI